MPERGNRSTAEARPVGFVVGWVEVLLGGACVACGSVAGAPVCAACLEALAPVRPANRCDRCGIPLARFGRRCARCRTNDFSFERATHAHRYDGVPARVLERYKLHHRPSLATVIADATAGIVAKEASELDSPVLVPAPSRRATVRERGFSSAGLIARRLGAITGIPVVEALAMLPRGSAQKHLSLERRRSNAFESITIAVGRRVPCDVVLFDDVFTTGATVDACARRLIEAGAERVRVVTFLMEY